MSRFVSMNLSIFYNKLAGRLGSFNIAFVFAQIVSLGITKVWRELKKKKSNVNYFSLICIILSILLFLSFMLSILHW